MDEQMHKGRKDGREERMIKCALQFRTAVLHVGDKHDAAS